jgi:hypothetical protein
MILFTCSPLGVNCNLIALVLLCFIVNVHSQSHCSSILFFHFQMFICNLIALVLLGINLSSLYQCYSWQANACHEYVTSCLTFYCIEVSWLYIYNIGQNTILVLRTVSSFNLGLELLIVSIYCMNFCKHLNVILILPYRYYTNINCGCDFLLYTCLYAVDLTCLHVVCKSKTHDTHCFLFILLFILRI